MDLSFSEMSVDTSLAQEYLKKNEVLLEMRNDYNGTIGQFGSIYDGKVFTKNKSFLLDFEKRELEGLQETLLNMASKLKQNATLITQLEYYIRNIPIEVTSAQLNLIIQYIWCHSKSGRDSRFADFSYPNEPLLLFGRQIFSVCCGRPLESRFKETAVICHLLLTLLHEAGAENVLLNFVPTTLPYACIDYQIKTCPIKGLDSGTVAVVSDDADVDSAVDKFLAVSIQAPWRLRRILVQESVYQQFKDALSWKCNLNKSGSKSLNSDVLCSDTLTYNDRTFLIDPVELSEEKPSVLTVEAYRTTKEMISLVQQYQARYLSLWTNGIAEINEVTHSTKSPVVWVNNVADFRGPPQVSNAVFSYFDSVDKIKKSDKVAKLCALLQSWTKLDLESRRDILCGVLDKYIVLDPANKLYTDIRNSLSACTLKSFVDVGKDYVCIGMSQPRGIIEISQPQHFSLFSVESFESILQGNALIVSTLGIPTQLESDLAVLEQVGVPVASCNIFMKGDFEICSWDTSYPTRTRVIWTNSGTIFAN